MSKHYYFGRNKDSKKKYVKILGYLSIVFGFCLLVYFFLPIISWRLYLAPLLAVAFETPIPKYAVVGGGNFRNILSERISALSINYEDARNWYPNLKGDIDKNKDIKSYKLSIAKLGISDATVATSDYDLSSHLVQYLGTSLPGQLGSAVIFGHSTLPQLFNPKDYKTIFATLHLLKINDEVLIDINGIIYKYKIFSITITDPEDTNIFSQNYDDSYITLVTCTPPGTVWKRLIVRARLTI